MSQISSSTKTDTNNQTNSNEAAADHEQKVQQTIKVLENYSTDDIVVKVLKQQNDGAQRLQQYVQFDPRCAKLIREKLKPAIAELACMPKTCFFVKLLIETAETKEEALELCRQLNPPPPTPAPLPLQHNYNNGSNNISNEQIYPGGDDPQFHQQQQQHQPPPHAVGIHLERTPETRKLIEFIIGQVDANVLCPLMCTKAFDLLFGGGIEGRAPVELFLLKCDAKTSLRQLFSDEFLGSRLKQLVLSMGPSGKIIRNTIIEKRDTDKAVWQELFWSASEGIEAHFVEYTKSQSGNSFLRDFLCKISFEFLDRTVFPFFVERVFRLSAPEVKKLYVQDSLGRIILERLVFACSFKNVQLLHALVDELSTPSKHANRAENLVGQLEGKIKKSEELKTKRQEEAREKRQQEKQPEDSTSGVGNIKITSDVRKKNGSDRYERNQEHAQRRIDAKKTKNTTSSNNNPESRIRQREEQEENNTTTTTNHRQHDDGRTTTTTTSTRTMNSVISFPPPIVVEYDDLGFLIEKNSSSSSACIRYPPPILIVPTTNNNQSTGLLDSASSSLSSIQAAHPPPIFGQHHNESHHHHHQNGSFQYHHADTDANNNQILPTMMMTDFGNNSNHHTQPPAGFFNAAMMMNLNGSSSGGGLLDSVGAVHPNNNNSTSSSSGGGLLDSSDVEYGNSHHQNQRRKRGGKGRRR